MADSVLSIVVKFAALDALTRPLRAMGSAGKATARDLIATRKEILGLEKAAAQVGAYRDQQAAIAKTHAEMDIARRRVAALRAAIQQTDGPTGRLANQLSAATGKLERLDSRLGDQVGKLGALRTGLQGAGIDVTRLADAERKLSDGLTKANRALDAQKEKQARAIEQARRMAQAQQTGQDLRSGGYRALAVGASVARPGLALAADARDFQSILVDIGLKADLSRTAIRNMGQEVLKIGPAVAQLPTDIAKGVDVLAGLGLDPRIATRIIAPIGKAATAYGAEVSDLARATYASIDTLRVPVNQTTRALDIMAASAKAGGFEIGDMAREFPALTAAAAGLGQTGVSAVADLSAAAQIAFKGTGDSATAANNLLNLLNKINSNETTANFKKFGVDLPAALKKAYAEGKTPIEAIIDLTRKATGGDLSKLPKLFGDAQVQAAVRILLQNTELYRKIRADALNATGTVEADFANRSATDAAVKQAKFNAQLERLKIVVGNNLLPALNRALELGGNFADMVSDWTDRNPAAAQAIAVTATVLGLFASAVGVTKLALGFIWQPLVMIFGWLGKLGPVLRIAGAAFGWIAEIIGIALVAIAAFLGIPVWAAALLVAAVIAAGIAIYAYWDQIVAGGRALWAGITSAFNSGVAWLGGLVPNFGTIGAAMLQGLLSSLSPLTLVRHILKLGSLAVTALKSVLGIKSPSRVFAGIGDQMMAGLGVGLDRGVDRPLARLRSVGADFGRAISVTAVGAVGVGAAPALASPPAQPPRAAAAPVTKNYYLSIDPGAGPDAAEFARKVMEEIKLIEEAEARSSYRDDA